MNKLSPAQQKALNKMELGKWYSSYELQVSLATLGALLNKGMVESKSEIGYLYSPCTCILWSKKENK